MTLPYCTETDVERKLDELDADYRGQSFTDRVRAKMQAVSQRWDSQTGTPMRTVRVGSPSTPRTYARHDTIRRSGRKPLLIDLEYGDVVPLDASTGDVLEVRTGRNSWDGVTTEEGDGWVLDHDRGQLKLFRFLIRRLHFESPGERFVRLSYRAGGLGGDRRRGGQTELDAPADSGDGTLSVQDAGRLPAPGTYVTIGAPGSQEYVRVTDIDYGADTVDVERGVRATTAASHADGDTVLYTPLDVREAVAAKVAAELVKDEESEISIPDDGQVVDRTTKADQWESDWEETAASHSSVRTL
jgi:hypothetical protein